jgi:hypothetical protein
VSAHAFAQAPAAPTAGTAPAAAAPVLPPAPSADPAPAASAPAEPVVSHSVEDRVEGSEQVSLATDSETDGGISNEATEGAFRPGFEAGLRLGAALPIGKAGRDAGGADRKLGDLTSWRAPVWADVAYRVSPTASYGVYGQIGFGGTGDGCVGKCDWADLHIGAQGQWRFSPESNIDPWLGVGVGWESLSYRDLVLETFTQTSELLGGPELLLQGGLELEVDKALKIGPYVSAGVGSYLRDSYKCLPDGPDCPAGSSVAGSGFHTWLGFGLSGRYSP